MSGRATPWLLVFTAPVNKKLGFSSALAVSLALVLGEDESICESPPRATIAPNKAIDE